MAQHPSSIGSVPLTTRGASPEAAVALAAFYGAGGLLCLASLVLPAWPDRHEAIILAVGLLATAVAGLEALAWRWVTRRIRYALVMSGSFLIAAVVYAGAGGAASATYAGFYVWVAVYSFVFFPPRWATAQVVVAVATEAAALIQVGSAASAPAQVTLSGGTIVATGAVVGFLADRLRTLTLTDELTGLPNLRSLEHHPRRPASAHPDPPVRGCPRHRPRRVQGAQRHPRARCRRQPASVSRHVLVDGAAPG